MNSPAMTPMGMKRKDMYGEAKPAAPSKPKDWDNEIVYPTVRAEGKQAEMLGAEDLEDGEMIQQVVCWRVKKTTIERDGEKRYELELHLVKASDPEPCDDEGSEDAPDDESDDEEISPGLKAILAGKAE